MTDAIPTAAGEESGAQSVADRITSNRSELEQTLDAIEDRLNVPKRVGKLTAKVRASYGENPIPWKVGAAAAVAVVGGLVAWALFSDD